MSVAKLNPTPELFQQTETFPLRKLAEVGRGELNRECNLEKSTPKIPEKWE